MLRTRFASIACSADRTLAAQAGPTNSRGRWLMNRVRREGLELVGEQNYEEITKQVRLDARRMIELERRRGVERATPEIDRGMGMSR